MQNNIQRQRYGQVLVAIAKNIHKTATNEISLELGLNELSISLSKPRDGFGSLLNALNDPYLYQSREINLYIYHGREMDPNLYQGREMDPDHYQTL